MLTVEDSHHLPVSDIDHCRFLFVEFHQTRVLRGWPTDSRVLMARDTLPDLIVPPMTPFTADGAVDYSAYKEQIDYIINTCGATKIPLMAVEAQEYRCLTVAERMEAIRQGIQIIDGRVEVIVGVSAPSSTQSVEIGSVLDESGLNADAIQLLLPRRVQGGDTRVTELIEFIETVSDGLSLPVIAYHNPGPGATLQPDTLVEIAKSSAVIGFKESSRNLRHVLNLIERIDNAGLAAYYTTMELLLSTLLLGGSGATMPAPPAKIARQLIDAVEAGEFDHAADLQRSFAEFPGPFLHHGFPTVMKAALDHVGVPGGNPYPPATPLSESSRDKIDTTLAEIGL